MTAVAFTSAKGSPGVTTTACAVTQLWPEVHLGRRVLLADADPAGGDVGPGWLRGTVDASHGISSLAADRGSDPVAAVLAHVVAVDEQCSRLVLLGSPDAGRTAAGMAGWDLLTSALNALRALDPPVDVVMDVGRLDSATDTAVLRDSVDVLVLVTGSTLRATVAARAAAQRLRAQVGPRLRLLVIGPDRPYSASEVAAACDVSLLGVLPWDPQTAKVFCDGQQAGRAAGRSGYLRAVRQLTESLQHRLDPGAAPAPKPPLTAEVFHG